MGCPKRDTTQNMRTELSVGSSQPHPRSPASSKNDTLSPLSEQDADENKDHQTAWARQEQQFMIREQDRTMDSLAGTLNTLAQQAGLMGQEILEHNELLDDLERSIDNTDSKLNNAMRQMRKFMRESEEKGSGWCIIILIIILMALLLAVILI